MSPPSATSARQSAAASPATNPAPSAPPEPAQCPKDHACHAKRRWMSPSATPATWNEGGCHQVPCVPRKVPRHHRRPIPPPEPAQCPKCHVCRAKRRWMHCPLFWQFCETLAFAGPELMGADASGERDGMQMPVTVPDITSELEQATILEELRTQRLALAEWRSGLDIVKAKRVHRLICAICSTAETLYDWAPCESVQLISGQMIQLNVATAGLLQFRTSQMIHSTAACLEPTGAWI